MNDLVTPVGDAAREPPLEDRGRARGLAPDEPLVLSARPVDARSRRAALAVAGVLLVLFLLAVPFAKTPLGELVTFVPVVQTALIVNDVITATLLFGQLRVTRSAAMLVLACGYVFTALMATVHMLSFPDVFSESGLVGGGAQTTAYLFVFWHSGFPVAVAAYAAMKTSRRPPPARMSPALAVAAVFVVVGALTLLATAGNDLLPPLLADNRYSSAFHVGRFGQWFLTAAAAVYLWTRRPHSVLDLWLLVVLTAWFFEIGLVAIFNAGRYDLGFYAGRIYGLLASGYVLLVLLTEQVKVYAGLLQAHETARSESALRQSRDVLRLAMQGGRMGVWTRNLVTGRVWWSAELEEICGLPPGGFDGTEAHYYALQHPNDRELVRRAVETAVERHEDFAVEFRFAHSSGEWRWMHGRGRATYDADGRATQLFGIGIDITARKRGEEAAERIESRFRNMADGMPHLAWMARPDGWVYWYNARWYEYTGTTLYETEGWGWRTVHDPQALPSVLEQWERSIATGRAFEMVLPLRGADGRFRTFLTRVSPLKDEEGNVVQWLGTSTDITAQRDAEEALRSADRRKDEFLATLAHELRNPLAPIRIAVDILGRVSPLPQPATLAREVIDRQSRHLSRLVDDLLDVSRITQGKVRLRRERVSLTETIRDALEACRPSYDAAGHSLEVRLPADSLEVYADPTRVVQIFANLLNNAAKFTPPGGKVFVSADVEDGYAAVRVRDTGVGIAPEHVESIFRMFSQVSPEPARKESGLGIGLALVRGLAELQGGSVQVYSAGLGQGSEFTVRLPLLRVETVEQPP